MQELEQQANDDMFVIVSDVHLDRPQVLEKLRERCPALAAPGGKLACDLPLMFHVQLLASAARVTRAECHEAARRPVDAHEAQG